MDGNPYIGPLWPYQQLANRLRPAVTAMARDQVLPSISHLCQEYGVAPKTVRKALRVLAAEDLIVIVPSRGAFRR